MRPSCPYRLSHGHLKEAGAFLRTVAVTHHRLWRCRSNGPILLLMPRRMTTSRQAVRFGAIIRRLREQRQWTLLEFGRKANMNPTYLGFIERGENSPTLDTVVLLAKVLGVEASEILREMEQLK